MGPVPLRTDNLGIAGATELDRLKGRVTLLELRVDQAEELRQWERQEGWRGARAQARATVGFLLLGSVIGLITTLAWIHTDGVPR
ncbi:MAG: hypothetical protein ACRDLL_11605 [Solirubrobacterales bacterium]